MTEIINSRHEIFRSIEDCFNILLELECISNERVCAGCGGVSLLRLISNNSKKRMIYRCGTKGCQKKEAILNTKLKINDFLLIIFKLMTGHSYEKIVTDTNTTYKTISLIRKKLRELMKQYTKNKKVLLGGPEYIVECDETVLCRRGIIKNPTSVNDEIPDTVWIVGCIDNSPAKNFYCTRVENREAITITKALDGKIGVLSNFHTDGFRSYPAVAKNLNLNHRVVNHSIGFKAPDGTHTNNIEGLWACMKNNMRREHGLRRDNIDEWLNEYCFLKRFVHGKDDIAISTIFLNLLKLLFKNKDE